ncbi:MAG: TA system VapC family ribonuclease toxin [Myxococcota bacterium]
MSATLLDLNVLIALTWPSHEHHRPIHSWFLERRSERWATCSFTQVGFVRLSSNPRVVDPPASPATAAELLRRLVSRKDHDFWSDSLNLADDDWPPAWVRGHRQTTDSHLVRLARHHRGKLATLDRGLALALGSLGELII